MAINTSARPIRLLLPQPLRYTLAIYQLAIAGWILFLHYDWLFAWHTDQILDRLLGATLLALSLLAGIYLLRQPQLGRTFTVLNQLLQLVAVAGPFFTFVARLGLAVTIELYATDRSNGPGTGTIGGAFGWFWGNTNDLAFGHPHPDHPGYMVSLNTLAAVILLATLFCRQKRTQTGP